MMMKKIKAGIVLLLSVLTFTSSFSFVQEETKISPYISFRYFKDTDNNTFLKTTLTYSKNRMEVPLQGAKVSFYSGTKSLSEIVTDNKGIAICKLNGLSDLSLDENGLWPFSMVYEGNDSIESGTSELLIRNASVAMELTEVDSIKTVVLKAEKSENGKMVPLSGEAITVYVPRMFSYLPVGEATFDDEGNATLEFPSDIPGDKDGNITVVAKFEEHAEFGNIETKTTLGWGVPPASPAQIVHRALWTKTAPRWMIYSLSVLLIGVWGHYLFAIISLIRIRRDAKRKEEEDDYGKK
jgi:hypothetical protein